MGFLAKIILAGAALLFITNLSSYIRTPWFVFELPSHFQFQSLILSALLLLVLLCIRITPPAAIILVSAALFLNVINLLPYADFNRFKIFRNERTLKVTPDTLSLLQANVFKFNFDYKPLLKLIGQTDPDIVVVFEMTPEWKSALDSLIEDRPYYIAHPKKGRHGIGLYSKYPLIEKQSILMSEKNIPALITRLQIGGQQLNLLAIHPRPPTRQRFFENRNQHFDWIIRHFDQFKNAPLVIAGDLNTTMFAPSYKHFIAKTGLNNARRGRGLQNSWSFYDYHLITGIPIDHFLYNDKVDVVYSSVTPDINSDHLPILTYFTLK